MAPCIAKPIRCFQHYTSRDRADRAASFRLTRSQRESVGEFFYMHPLRDDVAFATRGAAERAVPVGRLKIAA